MMIRSTVVWNYQEGCCDVTDLVADLQYPFWKIQTHVKFNQHGTVINREHRKTTVNYMIKLYDSYDSSANHLISCGIQLYWVKEGLLSLMLGLVGCTFISSWSINNRSAADRKNVDKERKKIVYSFYCKINRQKQCLILCIQIINRLSFSNKLI